MRKKRVKTFMDTLMSDKEFRERFAIEYQNLCISEQIARARRNAHLTQEALAKHYQISNLSL